MRRSRNRREAILAEVKNGQADVDRLAASFGVSASTIRRDLQELSASQAVTRTYGGAILTPGPVTDVEQSLQARRAVNRSAKAAIAAAALALLRDGERLILDGGSTVAAMGQGLRQRRHLIITNNMPLVPLLAGMAEIEVMVLGGAVRSISMATSGPVAEQALRQVTADICFVSADGVVAGRGLCEAMPEQTALKSLMMAQASEIVVLADSSKLGQAKQPFWAPLDRPWTLITDAAADPMQCRLLEGSGAKVIRAE
ncbi:DeoR/GlpR transcriptional regulator [Acidisoma cellulosilytica]|uniref:DeoR/GlpR transcriptional regulator n=1 Tax=Acidisoma cellulosilyticum TaxID=2802395 RepID=A0A963Z5G7_9PROT|nr:DeoR/GlpR family DNA-binding transcription regulator [Acidisoma cellulosilyticum]MCB8882237.1 DeoR/GlpR transcriptional regulator [Acidisoma cellulosilyticum]